MTATTTINRVSRIILPLCTVFFFLWAGSGTVFAADDFSNMVHCIESRYHAHRDLRFLMSFAGLAAKAWPGSGVRGVKIALFEDQRLFQSAPDREIEELIQSMGDSDWQPMVKSVSMRDGERTYVYVKTAGKDFKLLVVNVEANEAVVVEARLDSHKLETYLGDHSRRRHRHEHDSEIRLFD
jgi:hypothetical protein